MSRPKKLLLVAGARPNFMKIAPVIREIRRRAQTFDHRLVHTGQHYDDGMSDVFFRDLGIPEPDYHLEAGSGTHAQQTAAIMVAFEPIVEQEKPDCVVVFGDVNSTLACSVVAKKLAVQVAHVEAGLRSRDMSMPEEINRLVTDAISDYLFATEEGAVENLLNEGKQDKDVYHVGHVMIDNLFHEIERLRSGTPPSPDCTTLKERLGRFGAVTLHRASNVDSKEDLAEIISALTEIASELPLVFPVHPRTKARLEQFNMALPATIHATPPMGYRDFVSIWSEAAVVLTDSGGLQEETTALGVRCVTLRENTERPATVDVGTNVLGGVRRESILAAYRRAMEMNLDTRSRPPLWDGAASSRILDALDDLLDAQG